MYHLHLHCWSSKFPNQNPWFNPMSLASPCINLPAICVLHTFHQSCSLTAVCCLMSQQFLVNILCYIRFHMLSWAKSVLLCILNFALQYCIDFLMMAKNDQTCSYTKIKNSGCVRQTAVICSWSINTMGHTPLN